MTEIQYYLNSNLKLIPMTVSFFVKGNEVLLGLRKKVSLDLGLNIIAGIGGKIGDKPEYKDETPEESMQREIQEELGSDDNKIIVKEYKRMGRVRFINPHNPKWDQDVIIYVITDWEGLPTATDEIEPMWFDKNNLPIGQMWVDNTIWLPEVLNGHVVDAIFLYGEDNTIREYVMN